MSHLIHQLPLHVKRPCMISEFFSLTDRTRAIVLYVHALLLGKYNRIPVWDEFFRTQDQQDKYYEQEISDGKFVVREGKKLYSINGKTPTISPHQLYRAADLSRRNLSDSIVEKIIENVNKVFPGVDEENCARFFQEHDAPHLHFQSRI